MAWEKVTKPFWKTQIFNKTLIMSAKSQNFTLPEEMRGVFLQWYLDKDNSVAKLVIEDQEDGARLIAKKSATAPKKIRMAFEKETNLLVFRTKTSIYIGSYRKGKEAFEKFLRKDGVTQFD